MRAICKNSEFLTMNPEFLTMNPQPSADALRLAGIINQQLALCNVKIADKRLAGIIDRELQLPQKHAVLRLARGVVDIYDMMAAHKAQLPIALNDAFNELRDALAAITTKP